MIYQFTATLWRYSGKAAWHFVTLPEDVSDEIAEMAAPTGRGFGSVRVKVTIGSTTWKTSLFPDNAAGAYVLPIKKPVRVSEGLTADDELEIAVELVDD